MGRAFHVAKVPLIIAVLGAAVFFGVKARYGSYGEYYFVDVQLPRAGQLMRVGADVRERGVLIGTVSDMRLDGHQARLTLRIEEQYRVPADAQAYVDLKTLLGDKYVDLRFDAFDAPYLSGGETLTGHVGPELEDVLESGVDVLGAVDPDDAATVVHELATGTRGHGDDVARGLRANAVLSTTFAQTLEPQLQSLHDFHIIFGELRDRGVDLNALADAINQGVPVYASDPAHRQLRRALEALVPMADHFADLLILNRRDWDRMMDSGDVILQTIADRPQGLRDFVHGLYRYVYKLGGAPYWIKDASALAPFANFIGGEDFEHSIGMLCGSIPPDERQHIPVCTQAARE
jgi:phospholipid/cholesterol/gamma-HCH transport system substrate-binding protein